MRTLVIMVLAGVMLAACSSRRQTAAAPAGAVVAGPVVGALVKAPGRPGVCYRTDRKGRLLYDRSGQPRAVQC